MSINRLVDLVEEIANIRVERRYNLTKPTGVRGRNSDNSLIRHVLNWEPSISLRDGLEKTYAWIWSELVTNDMILSLPANTTSGRSGCANETNVA